MQSRLKRKPSRPERAVETIRREFGNGKSLQEVIDWFASKGKQPNEIAMRDSYNGGMYFEANTLESDESFNKKVAKYERKLKEFNQWIQDNFNGDMKAYKIALEQEFHHVSLTERKLSLVQEIERLKLRIEQINNQIDQDENSLPNKVP